MLVSLLRDEGSPDIYASSYNSLPRNTSHSVEYHVLYAIPRFHVFDLASKHHLVGFANLPDNINKRIVVHFSQHIKLFRLVIITQNCVDEWFVEPQIHEFFV